MRGFASALLLLFLASGAYGLVRTFRGCAEYPEGNDNDEHDGTFEDREASEDLVCACGASLPNALYQLATFAYSTYGDVSYTATGSTRGKTTIEYFGIDFAGSDSLLKDSQYTNAPDLQVRAPRAARAARGWW